ncbi:hypothetical protein BGZ80_011695 [Entomortierella chlamydospora]|uniref:Uncharacterized protein n=1 Tax=Entomortierella chlamydospora TaxID=101097 RepID=A0A9P6MTT6_9FUNG|nr:hypothetical protein BGZ80_011695 [Entomortierella chlamydospora]
MAEYTPQEYQTSRRRDDGGVNSKINPATKMDKRMESAGEHPTNHVGIKSVLDNGLHTTEFWDLMAEEIEIGGIKLLVANLVFPIGRREGLLDGTDGALFHRMAPVNGSQ